MYAPKLHIVVRCNPDGSYSLCMDLSGQPAIYVDSPPAEVLCGQMRESFPHNRYAVMDTHAL